MKEATAAGEFCDDDTPVFPIYAIDESQLGEPDDDGVIAIELPAPPARIRYEGAIRLCDDGQAAIDADSAPQPSQLQVTLHSKDLLVDDARFSVSFDAQTTAQLDPATGELTFCVQLMEGDYDVVVTPPTNLPCAVYAQHLLIEAPDDMAKTGMLLQLPPSAALEGTLQTTDEMPLSGATVEAVALSRATGIELENEELATLTRYNRSRQSVTEMDGTFYVPVDLGSYDVLFKPPAASGFAWIVRHDVGVGSRQQFSQPFEMPSPVMLSGRLAYEGGSEKEQAGLAGAEVMAFAVIADKVASAGDVAPERAVPIGKAMAGADGTFTLLLPQSIKAEW
jgi:hypothetical protein